MNDQEQCIFTFHGRHGRSVSMWKVILVILRYCHFGTLLKLILPYYSAGYDFQTSANVHVCLDDEWEERRDETRRDETRWDETGTHGKLGSSITKSRAWKRFVTKEKLRELPESPDIVHALHSYHNGGNKEQFSCQNLNTHFPNRIMFNAAKENPVVLQTVRN